MSEPRVDRQRSAALPVGAYVASALEAANIPCDSGEDVDRSLAELAKRGYGVTLTGADRVLAALTGDTGPKVEPEPREYPPAGVNDVRGWTPTATVQEPSND